MNNEAHHKVQAEHLRRQAFLYVRQSTMRQVQENLESTKRQYALQERALALGWTKDQIVVIDCDQGQSGGSAAEREGFQRLVTEVSMNRAGIVMGLEVSRLARNSSDWHRLLEICALTRTLLLDDDGLYDPAHFNDRLLLGLKGAMSEAELHVIRARLTGGLMAKARRGELGGRLATGFVYGPNGKVELDPDLQVQESFRHLFAAFQRTGSALQVVKCFNREGLKFPHRVVSKDGEDELIWSRLGYYRTTWILNCPRYAGAYAYGRTRSQKLPSGLVKRTKSKVAPEEWHAFVPNAHPGYISWEQYQENQKRLLANATAYRCQRVKTPPREGPSLLQGLAICGICGRRMNVSYHERRGSLYPDYICGLTNSREGRPQCQRISGQSVDKAVSELLLKTVNPLNIDVALAIEKELQARYVEVDRLRQQTVQRARQEEALARRRYMQTDPDNRLVAAQLEADWNSKLRSLHSAQEEYEKEKESDQKTLSAEQRRKVMELACDFPQVWNNPNLPHRERKRIAQLLLEDVTLRKDGKVIVQIRFKGGALQTLELPLPLAFFQMYRTKPEVVEEIDRLLDHHSGQEIAEILNAKGLRTGGGITFKREIVYSIIENYQLKPRHQRLIEAGLMNTKTLARQLHVNPITITKWRRQGLIVGLVSNRKRELFYQMPAPELLAKLKSRNRNETNLPQPKGV